jgi:hypothetical protein
LHSIGSANNHYFYTPRPSMSPMTSSDEVMSRQGGSGVHGREIVVLYWCGPASALCRSTAAFTPTIQSPLPETATISLDYVGPKLPMKHRWCHEEPILENQKRGTTDQAFEVDVLGNLNARTMSPYRDTTHVNSFHTRSNHHHFRSIVTGYSRRSLANHTTALRCKT